MGKMPAFQMYPNDWTRDLEEHPLEIEGAWIRLCCKLWWSNTRGKLTKTLEQWGRILRVSETDAKRILTYISDENIGTVTFNNADITVISRRIVQDEKARQAGKNRQERYREKHKNEPEKSKSNVSSQRSSSSSSSSSSISSSKDKKKIREYADEIYKAYPRKVAPKDAKKKIEAAIHEIAKGKGGFDNAGRYAKAYSWLLERTKLWAKACEPRERQFIPHPATWYNQGRYDENPEDWLKDNERSKGGFNEPTTEDLIKMGKKEVGTISENGDTGDFNAPEIHLD